MPFEIELGFYVDPDSSLHSDVMDMFAKMNGVDLPDDPEPWEKAMWINQQLITQVPFFLRVDGEFFWDIDRTSLDAYVVVLAIPQADVPDDQLYGLGDVETMVQAAAKTMEINADADWDIDIKPINEYDMTLPKYVAGQRATRASDLVEH